MRYTNNKILSKDKIPYYKGKIYPQIPLSENDIYIITTIGDRLDTLANNYYKDPTLWWVISIANNGIIPQDSLFITPGTQLRIPTDLNAVLNRYEQLNKIR